MTASNTPESTDPKQNAEELLTLIVEDRVASAIFPLRKSLNKILLCIGMLVLFVSVFVIFFGISIKNLKHPEISPASVNTAASSMQPSRIELLNENALSEDPKAQIVAYVSALMATSAGDLNEESLLFAYKLFSKRLSSDISQPVGTYPENVTLDFVDRDVIRSIFGDQASSLLGSDIQGVVINRQEALISRLYKLIQQQRDENLRKEMLRQTLGVAKIWVDQAPMLAPLNESQPLVATYQAMQGRIIDRLDTSRP